MVTAAGDTPDPAGSPWYTVHEIGIGDPRSRGRRVDGQWGQDDGGDQHHARTRPAGARAEQPHAPTGTGANRGRDHL